MQLRDSNLMLSASDLSGYLNCAHVTTLDLLLLHKKIPAPEIYADATLQALIKKGEEFEAGYIKELEEQGKTIVRISRDNGKAKEDTLSAMQNGVEIIYQARLEEGPWIGWADFLIKVDRPSALGLWSYEVEDTKFAKNTRASAILQICLYSQMLTKLQGIQPENMHVRTPAGTTAYRVDEYIGYLRMMQRKLLHRVETDTNTYPEPVPHCDICRWWIECNKQRRADDHLGFVAGMGRSQIREMKEWGIGTLKDMAQITLPLNRKPSRGSVETFTKLREQARVQLQARQSNEKVYELLSLQPDVGLYRLPEPSDGDFFFDFEGDPFVGDTGREYLFGWIHNNGYASMWAFTASDEKLAFEKFIDRVMAVREQYPGMHIYHYSAYEPATIKRLMGKYSSRGDEVDVLLRAGVFVDLHSVTRHALRAGIESYSLKELEKLHDYERTFELRSVGQHKSVLEAMLENGLIADANEETLATVQGYNREDCESTLSLRNWLEELRTRQIKDGHDIPRPVFKEGQASQSLKDYQLRIKPLFEQLTAGISPDITERSPQEEARWMLAHMLEWYHREDKSYWWNLFHLRGLPDDELLDERDAIAGLTFTGRKENVARSEVHYYSFPDQDTDIREGMDVETRDAKIGSVHFIDCHTGVIGIKKNGKSVAVHPSHIISNSYIDEKVKREAIIRVAESVIAHGIDENDDYKMPINLLLRRKPVPLRSTEDFPDAASKAIAWGMQLDGEMLPIQGPPGTGKSYTAALMILQLVSAGKQVGITALGHKVITALLQKVNKLAAESGKTVSIVQKVKERSLNVPDNWLEATKNKEVIDAIRDGVQVAAGTSFMWSSADFKNSVDVLFVDEAGQLALIDTVAAAHAGKNLVLLGDPQQLQQPQQGQHPEGTGVSALAHILDGKPTITEDKGVLLDKTWRLHPAICEYTSTLYYESRLQPMPGNELQQLEGETRYCRPGIYVEALTHVGNVSDSPEEVEKVRQIVSELVEREVYFINVKGEKSRLGRNDIKVIAPYNAQVNALSDALPGVDIGTVDRFQGQEAPVVICSMATSSPDDAPRGMEFLYSLNRLNVAVSRARAVFILVISEAMLQPNCRTPAQIRLANALCCLVEYAENGGQRAGGRAQSDSEK